ncbi:tannase and feruloyl esterase [Rickenella mellea]|uniref:Carboxylic ester hydrolase n=1 Tax=Rickenella mellea TaxID=50990 RepID=A0A4Y7Q096_9AGAM|nr:tannase and feruloyl esterase [Rickenella mellea]
MLLLDLVWSVSQLFRLGGQFSAADGAADRCNALNGNLELPDTTILNTSYIAGQTTVPTPGSCQPSANVPVSLCRVEFVITTSDSSSVHAEAWLPDEWSGRFLALGNGGLGGCIDYDNLDYGASLHFATVASDNGHDGNDGKVFWNQPEVLKDFAFRAVHVESVIGKQITEAYYGRKHDKSYFLGCSTGGRQATRAALSFPEDFDGIVAGAPATDFNHLIGWVLTQQTFFGPPPSPDRRNPNFIPPDLWDTVAEEILAQCDELDGVKDRIITEPDACEFRPESLICTGAMTANSTCLSLAQVEVLRKIYRPLYGLDGQLIYPRYDPGTEGDGNSQAVFSGTLFPISADWYKYTIFNDSEHDFSNFGLKDIALADSINPAGISTFDGDLSAFRDRGGKFISYHGRRDQLIPSGNSKRVYDLISSTLQMPTLDPFYRLFLVPGMTHCGLGPGAWKFGQVGGATSNENASTHNVLLAVVDWVESGVAPDVMVGTSDDGKERAHCRYPQRSVWDGEKFNCRR